MTENCATKVGKLLGEFSLLHCERRAEQHDRQPNDDARDRDHSEDPKRSEGGRCGAGYVRLETNVGTFAVLSAGRLP